MTVENKALREFLAQDHIGYQLDQLDSTSPDEAQRVIRSLIEQEPAVVAPLQANWTSGQVRAFDLARTKLWAVGIGAGTLLLAACLLAWVGGLAALIAAGVSSAIGVCLLSAIYKKAAREIRYLHRRAHWAGVILSQLTDTACVMPMLENCYGFKGEGQNTRVLVEPIAERLALMLSMADTGYLQNLSFYARTNVRYLLTKEWQGNPNSPLVREVINVVARAGLTEFAPEVRKIVSMRFAPDLLAPAESCLAILHELIEKRRHNDMLLRPSGFAGEESEFLLKPVDANSHERDDLLLRPAEDDK
jgi:hypothetical protein